MTLASSIRRASYMIREIASWLQNDIELGGFAFKSSLSALDLEQAETTLRQLADQIGERRTALIENVPLAFQEAAE
jgi:hypothetical protein